MSLSNKQTGMTLIEIMISITILAVGILGILQAFPRGISAQRDIEMITIAEQLAQAKIEEFVASDYNTLIPGLAENEVRVNADPTSPLYDFLRTSTITLVDSDLNNSAVDIGLKTITVTILRPAIFGNTNRTTTITFLKTKR